MAWMWLRWSGPTGRLPDGTVCRGPPMGTSADTWGRRRRALRPFGRPTCVQRTPVALGELIVWPASLGNRPDATFGGMSAPDWFTRHLGWKTATLKATPRCVKYFGEAVGPNLADLSGTSSTRIAGEAYRILNIPISVRTEFDIGSVEEAQDRRSESEDSRPRPAAVEAAGARLEAGLEQDIERRLNEIDPDRGWWLTRQGGVERFAQYEHLLRLQQLFDESATLKSTMGRDYRVSTDLMVCVPSPWKPGPEFMLHAAVSSKLTIRSDRVQNVRFEFGTLVRTRKGRLPHLVVVTAEPLPSRLVSIARGTGEIDAVYHLLYDELGEALGSLREQDKHLKRQWADWVELVETRRIRPYGELAEVLARS